MRAAKKRSTSIIARMCAFGTNLGGFSALPIGLSAYVEKNKKKFYFFRFLVLTMPGFG